MSKLTDEFRATAQRCRDEAKSTKVLERRFELVAKAEHLEELASETREHPDR